MECSHHVRDDKERPGRDREPPAAELSWPSSVG